MVLGPARALCAGLNAHLNLGPPPPAQKVAALDRSGGLAGREGLVPQGHQVKEKTLPLNHSIGVYCGVVELENGNGIRGLRGAEQ